MPRAPLDVPALASAVRAGERGAIARAITLVESHRGDHREAAGELLALLTPDTGKAVRVGITGVPGAGKSTFINAMGSRLVARGEKVAVVAVDPSSRRTGGSILGDRTRMADLTASDAAFVRPSPSGRHLGGVARATRESMLVLEAAGYGVVIVETVGVGQNEIAVSEMVDTFLLLTLARAGDQLQGIKRGILEMVDVIAVNKADGDGEGEARVAARELTMAMRLITSDPDARRPPVLTSSSLTGKGLAEKQVAGTVVNVGSQALYSLQDVLDMCTRLTNHQLEVRVNPAFVRANEVKTLCADTARLDLEPEASGLLAVSLGLSRMYSNDLAQLDAGMTLYDAFYRWCRDATDETHNWPSAKSGAVP